MELLLAPRLNAQHPSLHLTTTTAYSNAKWQDKGSTRLQIWSYRNTQKSQDTANRVHIHYGHINVKETTQAITEDQ